MNIRRALITAAGKDQRSLPLQTLVDRDGVQKSVLNILVDEVLSVGIEEICIVVWPGDEASYLKAAGEVRGRLQFVPQPEPRGYADAVSCCRDFIGNEPFLHLLGDHLYLSLAAKSCAQQLIEVAISEACAVSAVQPVREGKLPYYGAVGGRRVLGRQRLYLVQKVIEKPTPTEAELELVVPGLRAGHYLRFFGMHVITPGIMEFLPQSRHLSQALAKLAEKERYLAFEVEGQSYDVGPRFGLLTAQLALSLQGQDREEVLALIIELLASREKMRKQGL
jgi:UTP--glucose-1-phosphate uridylyltransferase